MVASIDDVRLVSRGAYVPVSAQDPDFMRESEWAYEKLQNDGIPDQVPPATYDRAQALLIVHYHFAGDQKLGLKSFTSGDFSGSQDPGQTVWLLEYERILTGFGSVGVGVEYDATRCDVEMPDMRLDQNDPPDYMGRYR